MGRGIASISIAPSGAQKKEKKKKRGKGLSPTPDFRLRRPGRRSQGWAEVAGYAGQVRPGLQYIGTPAGCQRQNGNIEY